MDGVPYCVCLYVAGPREESDLHAALLAGSRRGAHLGELVILIVANSELYCP